MENVIAAVDQDFDLSRQSGAQLLDDLGAIGEFDLGFVFLEIHVRPAARDRHGRHIRDHPIEDLIGEGIDADRRGQAPADVANHRFVDATIDLHL